MTRYPLTWPAGQPRTPSFRRQPWKARDKTPGFEVSREDLVRSLKLLHATDVVLSTNVRVRGDGYPYAGEAEKRHDDPGVAVYFKDHKGAARVIAVDTYTTLTANVRAALHTVDALRTLARHGAAQLERAFVGFSALPPAAHDRPWHEILGVPAHTSTDQVKSRYRYLAHEFHPDKTGGDDSTMKLITEAFRRFEKERGL